MNPTAERTFRMKFTKLAMMLNFMILLVAIGILARFGLIPFYSIQIAVVCFVLAGVIAYLFAKHYKRDKEWLMAQD